MKTFEGGWTMTVFDDAQIAQMVAYYVATFGCEDGDACFHCLLDIGPRAIPDLIRAFHAHQDVSVRELLVRVIWEHRESSVIPFLEIALRDSEPRVWRQALDGLVAIASSSAIDVLKAAKDYNHARPSDTREFHLWLEEAIEQAETVLSQRHIEIRRGGVSFGGREPDK